MSWLERLKAENFSACTPCEELTKPTKAPSVSFVSPPHSAHGENSQGAAAPAWLLHFPDADPLEVHFIPAATHAEALAYYPDAVAAEPLQQSPIKDRAGPAVPIFPVPLWSPGSAGKNFPGGAHDE